MIVPKSGLGFVGLLIVSLIFSMAGDVQAQDPYDKLESVLSKRQRPDTALIRSLPEPRTARQFWLRSRVETPPDRVKSLLRKAILRTDDTTRWLLYMNDWMSVALLDDSSPRDIQFLRAQLDDQVGRSSGNGDLWIKAAQLARYLQHPEVARTYYKQAMADSSHTPPALLGLAELSMAERDYGQAREYLEEYLLEYPDQPRPQYWLLKGQLFEETGSDSEARVAYRHILEQYPEAQAGTYAQQRLRVISNRTGSIPDTPDSSRDPSENQRVSGTTPSKYALQIGSFRERERAERLRSTVRDRLSRTVVIEPAMVQGARYYRVVIPGFSNLEDARGLLRRLKVMGFRGFLRKNLAPGT